jgi:ABC-type amino acid transport system permease subunit
MRKGWDIRLNFCDEARLGRSWFENSQARRAVTTNNIRHQGIGMNTPVKKPSALTLLLALIPFIAMCFSVAYWDRIDPMLFGLPFNLFWLISWIILSSVCMAAAYRIETARDRQDGAPP